MPDPTAEAILSRLIEAVPGGVVHVAADGAILRANPAATRFLGLSYDALTDRFTQDFAGDTWFEDGRPCGLEDYPVTRTLTTGQPAGPTTIGVRQPGGDIRWAVFRAVPVEGGGVVVTFLDITERRASEQRLRTSDRLASLGRLAAGVAHEINNPLTWSLLNLDRALELDDPAEAIASARDGLERVAGIVRDLGAMTRVEDATSEPFDVHAAIEKATKMASSEVRHRALLEIDHGPVAHALGLESRTVQILLNLLLNAAQSIPPGARADNRILVRTRQIGEHIAIQVRDTGAGMSSQVLEHAMDPFFTTKQPGEGMGLGLAISHALAAAMDGRLELDSTPGSGTSVTLTLRATGEAPPAPAEITAPRSERPRSVLVADDEPSLAQLMRWILAPHEVTIVGSGREALEKLALFTPDCIVCDLMMPEVTGMALHAQLHAERPELLDRLVFITGGAYTPEARRFVARPDVRCLAKPFRAPELRALVESILSPEAPAS